VHFILSTVCGLVHSLWTIQKLLDTSLLNVYAGCPQTVDESAISRYFTIFDVFLSCSQVYLFIYEPMVNLVLDRRLLHDAIVGTKVEITPSEKNRKFCVPLVD
jgi:hypothetical protein